jgi:hypothetical protein
VLTGALVLAGLAAAAAGQAPAGSDRIAGIVNATVERRAPAQGLAREVEAIATRGGAAWIGYRVPIAPRETGQLTASGTCCGRCRLAPPADLLVLARVEQGEVVSLRPVAVDCDLDASGAPLVWLDGVSPDESVTWLRTLVDRAPGGERRMWTSALAALAYHAAPSAVTAMTQLARSHPDREVRRQAMVRLGQSRDPQAAEFLADILID